MITDLIAIGTDQQLANARDTYFKMACDMERSTHSHRETWTETFLNNALEAEHALTMRRKAPNAAMHRMLDGGIVWRVRS